MKSAINLYMLVRKLVRNSVSFYSSFYFLKDNIFSQCKLKNHPILLIILSILKNCFSLCIHHFSKYFSN